MSHTEARRVTKQYTDIVSNLTVPERYSASVWGPLFKTSTLPTDRPSDRVGYVLYSDSGSLGSTTPVNPDDLLLLPIPQLLHQPPCRLLSLCHYIVLPFFLYILIIPRFRTNVHLFFHFLWTFFCYEKKICGLLRSLRYTTVCTFSLVLRYHMYIVYIVRFTHTLYAHARLMSTGFETEVDESSLSL